MVVEVGRDGREDDGSCACTAAGTVTKRTRPQTARNLDALDSLMVVCISKSFSASAVQGRGESKKRKREEKKMGGSGDEFDETGVWS